MSINSNAIAVFGICVDSDSEALAFFEKHGVEDFSDGIEHGELGYSCLNYFTGNGYVLGFGMKLGETVDGYQAKWDQLLPNATERPYAFIEVVTS